MHMRNTVLMAGLLVLLAGFVYIYEIRGREAREETERLEGQLVQFEIEDVERVEVTTENGTVLATRSEGQWSILEPAPVAADGEAIDSLVDRVRNARHERVVAEAAEDLAPFGLDDPSVRVSIGITGGAQVTVAVGKDTPVGPNLYVTTGDDRTVYSIARTLRNGLDKNLLDLRDRTVLDFEESAVEAIEITTPELTTSLQRDTEDAEPSWAATQPFTGRADEETIEDLLSSLHTAEAEAFVLDAEPDDAQLAEYGLDDPDVSLTLRVGEGASHALLVGGDSEEPDGRFAMHPGGRSVFVVGTALVEDLPSSADTLRNKQVLALARERVKSMRLVGDGQPIRLERDGVDWRITEPRPIEADASAVSRLLSTLQDLRAEGFGGPGQADEDWLTVTIGLGDADTSDNDETLQLRVGATTRIVPLEERDNEDAEEVEARFVTSTGDAGTYIVSAGDLEGLQVALFDLRAKTLVQFTQTDLTTLKLDAGDESYELTQDGDSWRLMQPTARELEEGAVSDLLWELNYLRMEGVATEWDGTATPALAEWGLESPRFRIVARTAEDTAAEVLIGNETPGAQDETSTRIYARVGGRAAVFEISASLADTLQELVETLRAE